MFKSCLKLSSVEKINRCLLKCAINSPRLINGKRPCSKTNQFDGRIGKVMYLKKYRRVLDEMQTIEYENRFQNQRYDKLSPIKASDYKKWLQTLCLEEEDSTLAFERKLRRVKLVVHVYNDILEKTFRVPKSITTNAMQDLLEVDAIEEITEQINYLYDLEMKRWTEKQFRKDDVVKTKERLELKHIGRTSRIGIFDEQNEIIYGLWHNTLFTRIKPKIINNYISRTRLKNSAVFGQKIVIDFGFEEFLDSISSKQLMSYLVKMLSFNKYKLEESYDISFTNFNSSGFLMKLMDNYFRKHDLHEYYIDIRSDSYLNHFDFSHLCYICPQADEPLRVYDHNAVYVLPGVVHHRMDPPLSLMRVKHEGIQMKRIPIEDYGILRHYHLELSHTLQILSHLKRDNDINKAIQLSLPKDVWKEAQEVEDEDEDVVKKLFYNKMIASQRKAKVYRKPNV